MLVLIFLCLLLFGCSFPVTVKNSPLLTRDCDVATTPPVVWRDLALRDLEWQKAVEECSGRMRVLAK
jgi:hypothetical protein